MNIKTLCALVFSLLFTVPVFPFAVNKITFSTSIFVKDLESEKELNNLFFEIIDQTSGKVLYPKFPITNNPLLFNLDPEKVYTAIISKPGYVNYVLTINTKNISKSKQLKSKYQIEIIGDLLEELKDEDYSAFQKSFGTIKFSLQENDFIWNPNKSLFAREQEIKKTRSTIKKEGSSIVKQQLSNSLLSKAKSSTSVHKSESSKDTLPVKSVQSETKHIYKGEMIITHIIFQNGQSDELRKISYEWGGRFYKLNQNDITEEAYNLSKAKYGF